MNVLKKIRLEFEDKGQDFLWWKIEYWTANSMFGLVVDCGPFQGNVWIGHTVLMSTCEEGDCVEFGKQGEDDEWNVMTLKYKTIKREEISE